jgi:YebC/PmpR family DNA-binding regulatory protein
MVDSLARKRLIGLTINLDALGQLSTLNQRLEMAGHSKWAKVKHFKGAIDAKRAKIFSKLSKEIAIAARLGGGDPSMNPRLRMVLLKCRAANMPGDNIERAIKKGSGGGETANFEDLTYEIYGPNGVAVLVEVSTDNRNRTAAEIRSLVTKNGGTMASPGSVSRLFQRKGQIIIGREAANEDQVMEVALEAGAEDFKAEPQGYEIVTDPAHFEAVHKQIEAKGIKPDVSEVTELPTVTVPLQDDQTAAAVNKLIDALEDHDEVKEVYSNAQFSDEG